MSLLVKNGQFDQTDNVAADETDLAFEEQMVEQENIVVDEINLEQQEQAEWESRWAEPFDDSDNVEEYERTVRDHLISLGNTSRSTPPQGLLSEHSQKSN